jgi:hypothetical protein
VNANKNAVWRSDCFLEDIDEAFKDCEELTTFSIAF